MMITSYQNTYSPSTPFLDYLKKWLREMPVGVCREMIGVHEIRVMHLIAQQTQARDVPQEYIDGLKEIKQTMRNCLDAIDTVIMEHGENVPLGDNPDYDDDVVAEMFLKAIGW